MHARLNVIGWFKNNEALQAIKIMIQPAMVSRGIGTLSFSVIAKNLLYASQGRSQPQSVRPAVSLGNRDATDKKGVDTLQAVVRLLPFQD